MARRPMFHIVTCVGRPLNRVHVPDTKRRLIALAAVGCQPQDCELRLRVAPIPADSDGNGAERMRGRSTRFASDRINNYRTAIRHCKPLRNFRVRTIVFAIRGDTKHRRRSVRKRVF